MLNSQIKETLVDKNRYRSHKVEQERRVLCAPRTAGLAFLPLELLSLKQKEKIALRYELDHDKQVFALLEMAFFFFKPRLLWKTFLSKKKKRVGPWLAINSLCCFRCAHTFLRLEIGGVVSLSHGSYNGIGSTSCWG